MDLSNENIIHVKKDGYEYLQFKKLLEYPELWHAFVIKPLNFRGNKAEKTIAEDYENFCDYEGLDYKYVVRALQEHTDIVKNITEKKNPNYVVRGCLYTVYLEEEQKEQLKQVTIEQQCTLSQVFFQLMMDYCIRLISEDASGITIRED